MFLGAYIPSVFCYVSHQLVIFHNDTNSKYKYDGNLQLILSRLLNIHPPFSPFGKHPICRKNARTKIVFTHTSFMA